MQVSVICILQTGNQVQQVRICIFQIQAKKKMLPYSYLFYILSRPIKKLKMTRTKFPGESMPTKIRHKLTFKTPVAPTHSSQQCYAACAEAKKACDQFHHSQPLNALLLPQMTASSPLPLVVLTCLPEYLWTVYSLPSHPFFKKKLTMKPLEHHVVISFPYRNYSVI